MQDRFRETYRSMREAVGYEKPISYQEWMNIRDDYKAAWLFVQFFDQISLAWYKVSLNNQHADADNGVSEMLSYCVKNVTKIQEDAKRFTPNYMYTVAYNCLYCIAIDRVGFKMTYEQCVSQYIHLGEDELDIFDICVANTEDPLEEITQKDIWKILQKLISEEPTEKVIKVRKPDGEYELQTINPREQFQAALENVMSGGRLTKANRTKLQTAFAQYARA